MDLKLNKLVVGNYQANCYVLFNENKEAIIIDPGDEPEEILKLVNEKNLDIKYIIITHAHPDHFGAVNKLNNELKTIVCIGENDEDLLKKRSLELSSFLGLENSMVKIDKLLKDNEEINFGDEKIKIIETSGHTPGGICVLIGNLLFTGDTLFSGTIGRTDLLGGNYEDILKSLKKLAELPDSTIVFPGHGVRTTIGDEKKYNPFYKQV